MISKDIKTSAKSKKLFKKLFFKKYFFWKQHTLYLHPQNCTGDFVAQLVEQYTFNVWVLGSNPSEITTKKPHLREAFLFYFISIFETNSLDDVPAAQTH